MRRILLSALNGIVSSECLCVITLSSARTRRTRDPPGVIRGLDSAEAVPLTWFWTAHVRHGYHRRSDRTGGTREGRRMWEALHVETCYALGTLLDEYVSDVARPLNLCSLPRHAAGTVSSHPAPSWVQLVTRQRSHRDSGIDESDIGTLPRPHGDQSVTQRHGGRC